MLIPFVFIASPICFKTPSSKPFISRNFPYAVSKGFTLTELIIALTVAGILTAIAAPNIGGFLSSNRLTAQINDLSADLNLARTEAIKRNASAGVCVSSSGTGCATGSWQDGWLVYIDMDGTDGWSSADTVIGVHEKLSGSNTLAGTAMTIVYGKSGIVISGMNATYTLCDPNYHRSRIITISTTGRASRSEGNC